MNENLFYFLLCNRKHKLCQKVHMYRCLFVVVNYTLYKMLYICINIYKNVNQISICKICNID